MARRPEQPNRLLGEADRRPDPEADWRRVPTTYLLGELDILPLGGFDGSCPAMAQGPTRLARGQAFAKHANEKFGAKHTVTIVPLCGHNARCIFTSEAALPLIFPKD